MKVKRIITLLLVAILVFGIMMPTSLATVGGGGSTKHLTMKVYTDGFESSAGGTVTPSDGNYQKDSWQEVTATANDGYEFERWSDNVTPYQGRYYIEMDQHQTVIAYFKSVQPYLEINIDGNGTTTPEGSERGTTHYYTAGTSVDLSASANQGNVFVGFYDDRNGGYGNYTYSNEITSPYTVNSNNTIYAVFNEVQTYDLTIDKDGAGDGTVTLDPPGGSYTAETVVTLSASPNATSTFRGFYKTRSGNYNNPTYSDPLGDPAQVTMNDDMTIYAVFDEVQTYTVDYHSNGGQNSPSDEDYAEGAIVTVADPGSMYRYYYEFTGWNTQSNGEGTHYDPGNTFAMGSQDVDLYAEWGYIYNHVDVWLDGTLTIVHQKNGVTQSTTPLNVTVSHPSASVVGPDTFNLSENDFDLDSQNNEFSAEGLSFLWPDTVIINATLTDQNSNTYDVSQTFGQTGIQAAWVRCPGSESGGTKGFDFVINAQDIQNQITHTVTFKPSAGGTLDDGNPNNVVHTGVLDGSSCPAPPSVNENSGYSFKGWKKTGDTTLYSSDQVEAMTVNSDMTFTAQFEENQKFSVKNMNGSGGAHGYIQVDYNGDSYDLTYGQEHEFVYDANAADVKVTFIAYQDWTFKYYVIQNGATHIEDNPDEIDPAGYLTADHTIKLNPKWETTLINVTGYNDVYDGMQHSVTVSGTQTDDTVKYSTDGGANYSTTKPTFTNVTSASGVTVHVKVERENADAYTGSAVVKITPATLAVTAKDKTITYGDAAPAYTAEYTGFVNGETESVLRSQLDLSGVPSLTCGYVQGSNAGSYPIVAAQGTLAATNYTFTYNNGTLTVNNADMTVDATGYSGTYDGTAHDGVTSVTPSESDATITYSTDGTTYSSTMPQYTNAGTYTMYVKASKANYNDATKTVTVTIGKAELTVTADDDTITYGDAAPTPYTYKITGYVGGDTVSVLNNTVPVLDCSYTQGNNAGTYDITVTQGSLAADNYTFKLVKGTLTVSNAGMTVDAAGYSGTYDGTAHDGVTSVTPSESGATITYSTNGITYSSTMPQYTNAGTYTMYVKASKANYNDATKTVTVTIDKAELTVTAKDKTITYGDAAPTFEAKYSGFVNSETESELSGTPSLTCGYVQGNNAGSYPIVAAQGSLAATNYTFTYNNGTLTVNKADMTVNATGYSGTYDGAAHDGVTSVTPSESDATITYSTDGITYSSTMPQYTNAGTYTMYVKASKANYNDATKTVTVTIDKAELTVTADNKTATYGDAPPTYTASYSGFIGTDNESILSGDPEFICIYAQGDGAGTYGITPAKGGLSDLTNYSYSFADGTLTVGRATLTVTVDAKTVTYLDDPPAYTYTIAGYVGDDTSAVVSGTPTLTCSYANGDLPGTYDIIAGVGTLAADNYTFSLENGELTVEVLMLTVTFADYDGTVLSTQSIAYGQGATPPAAPSREGYTFNGWDISFDPVTANITVTAQYTINTFTVRFFEADGTTQIGASQTIDWGTAASRPGAPVVDGSTFTGWSLTGDDAAEITSLNNVRENIDAVATYDEETFTVTFVDHDGEVLGTDDAPYGGTATPPTDPTREGYTFDGWSPAYDNVTGDITVTAQYAINTFTVTFVDHDGSVIDTQTIEWQKGAAAPDDPSRDDYDFTGWDVPFDNVTADTVVTAQYKEIETVEQEPVPQTGPDNNWLWWLLLLIPLAGLLWLIFAWILRIVPIAETVVDNGNGTFTITWGYENRKLSKVSLEDDESVLSALLGKILGGTGEPPVEFEKGRVENVFTTVAERGSKVEWKIKRNKARVDLNKDNK